MENNSKVLKKLSRSGYRYGKSYKKESNRDIRNSEEYQELEQMLHDESYLYLTRHEPMINGSLEEQLEESEKKEKVPVKKYNDKEVKRLIHQVKHAVKLAQIYNVPVSKLPEVDRGDFFNSFNQSAYQRMKKAVEELPKYLEKEEVPNKIKKQIREILDKL